MYDINKQDIKSVIFSGCAVEKAGVVMVLIKYGLIGIGFMICTKT